MSETLSQSRGAKTGGAILRVAAFLLILIGTIYLLSVIVEFLPLSLSDYQLQFHVSPILTLLAAVLATWVMLLVDKKPWSAVGLGPGNARPAVLAEGLMLGVCAIAIPSLLLISFSLLLMVPSTPGSSAYVAAMGILTFLPAAFFEELVMRGYLFSVLRGAFGWRGTLIVTSVVFGLLHLGNSNVDPESIALVILAGFFLGAILLATGSLFAVGMAHFGWNWVMAAVLHANVSGESVPAPDFRTVDNGPDWLTGGAWGPEGGIAAGFGMIVVFVYLYARRIRRLES